MVDGNVEVIVEPGAARLTRWAPGATTSGLSRLSAAVGPREEKSGTTSSSVDAVPASSTAPTVKTNGSSPGLEMVEAPGPRCEAATLTTIADFQACSTAEVSGATR